MVISKLITNFTEQFKTIAMDKKELNINTREEVRNRNIYERNMLRSELCVMVHVALNNFKCVNIPGRKPTRDDIVNVLSSIISNKTKTR